MQSSANRVSIWFCNIETIKLDEAAVDALLLADEQQRARRFAFPHLRRRYSVGRAALRRILAHHLGVLPKQVTVAVKERGKPYVDGGPEFNMSSSGPLLMIGVSDSAQIGVDIELLRELDELLDLARRYFSPAEVSALQALPAALRVRAFFRGWARKEALSKAVGDGLHLDFRSFSVPLDGIDACSPVAVSAGFPHSGAWFVKPAAFVTEAESAVAADAPIEIAARYRIQPDLNWLEESKAT
jgi:4'-phosphopantetheinyl transferase